MYQEEFLSDDQFIKCDEFKNFLIWKKSQEVTKALPEGMEPSEETMRALTSYDPSLENINIDEAREMVKSSGMLLTLGWDLTSAFIIDQIRKQPKGSLSYKVHIGYMIRGSVYDPKS